MALKITSEIATSAGLTSEAYLNIEKLTFIKEKAVDVWINLYLNETIRESYPKQTTDSSQVPVRFGISNEGDPSNLASLDTETIYQFAYSYIKNYLEEKGLTVEDLI